MKRERFSGCSEELHPQPDSAALSQGLLFQMYSLPLRRLVMPGTQKETNKRLADRIGDKNKLRNQKERTKRVREKVPQKVQFKSRASS